MDFLFEKSPEVFVSEIPLRHFWRSGTAEEILQQFRSLRLRIGQQDLLNSARGTAEVGKVKIAAQA
jgi:hypothetical protein